MAYIFVNVNRSVGTINPNIYGQFSEHLGRCVYQGIYVGQASDIPNTNGMRNDVVSALKALHVPVLRWLDESQQADKLFENQQLLRQPIVRNGRAATVGYRPEVWEKWE